jgi:lactoylglutathione lyase
MKTLSVLLVAMALAIPVPPVRETKRPPLVGIDHVAFRTSDVAGARAFYGDLLGLAASESTVLTVTINARQRVFIEPGLSAGHDERLLHIALATSDLDAMATYLRNRRVTFNGPARGMACGSRGLLIIDPDGHTIELVQESAIVGAPRDSASALSARLLHAGVTVRDEAAASGFYHDVLAMDEIWRGGADPAKTSWVNMRVPEGTDYLEYMLRDSPSSRRQLGVDHHICLLVPDIQRAWEQVRQRTAIARRDALEPPRIGRNLRWQLNLYDPDGTRVELMEPFTAK